ncbi:MAG TPA: DUF1003 domain-containing protein [Fimbriimonadaceae bacterium]|nr:DUF1003 domain-containing protein [Fimbriimonadaceae bacterium]
MTNIPRKVRCIVTGKDVPASEAIPVDLVRESLLPTLKAMAINWNADGYVSLESLNVARLKHIEDLLKEDQGETRTLNEAVLASMHKSELLTANSDLEFDQSLRFGERLADKIASFGGSWGFIICFGGVILGWMMLNIVLLTRPFDPFPFILLNLVLSCLAAIQAPVIMMSQNRQEARDRLRGINDYKVNLKAELEIRHLHEKLDKLMQDQWQHLLEIQQMQVEMMQEWRSPQS